MGHTCNSIVINAPYDLVFDISNDIPRWTELFGKEYKKAEVVKKEGNKITFRLTDEDDKTWQSWRLLFKDKYFTYAEREEPKFPFKYMKITWLYTPKPEGMALATGSQTTACCPVEMAWIQHFEMDEKAKFSDKQVEGFINEGSQANLKIFKEIIEKKAREAR
ncbi:MAG: polyketide cyclase [Candidatus Omnitrophica bacterium]|nr:polyketide cyclase [Candidatus Omnitrophota bacterium]